VAALCNPPRPPILTLTANKYLIEINEPTDVTLTYAYTQNAAGGIDPIYPVTYKRGATAIVGNVDRLTASSIGTVTYSVELRTLDSTQYPSALMTATDTVKVIYPFLIGAGPTNTLSSVNPLEEADKQALHDISATRYLVANFDSIVPPATPTPQNYYWFAAHQSQVPTEWVAVDANGVESALNRGPISTGFSDIGNLTFKGQSYKLWMGIQPTFYSSRIKIKF